MIEKIDKTPISYYGGKQNLVDEILPLLDYTKKQFVSLFTGGGAIEMVKRKHEVEVWNDLDDRVIAFWEVLQDEQLYPELEKLIKKTLHAESYWKKTKEIMQNAKKYTKLEVAWAFWVQCNMSFGNRVLGGFAFANDNSRNLQTANKREAFTDKFYKRARLVQIFNRDAIDLLLLKDTPDTFFFADPPYFNSMCGEYEDMFKENDMLNLLMKLTDIKGTFLLTSYPSDMLNHFRLKNGWQYKDIQQNLSVHGKREEQKFKVECITWNYKIQQTLELF